MKTSFFSIVLATSFLTGCTATLVKIEPTEPAVKTVKMYTGSALDDGVYESAFEKGASKACGGKDYEVIERTRAPSTLVKAGIEFTDSNDFYWVVRCK